MIGEDGADSSRLRVLNAESCLCAGEDEDQFEQFMLPLTAAFEAVAQMLSTNTFNEQEAKVTPSDQFLSCCCETLWF